MKKLIQSVLHGFALLAGAYGVCHAEEKPILTENLKDNVGLLYQVNPDCAKEVLISKTTHEIVKTIYVGSSCPVQK